MLHRRSPVILIALLATCFASVNVANGQNGDVVIDTLDWHGYFPLAVGNRWQYEHESRHPLGVTDQWIEEWSVTRDSTVNDTSYFVLSIRCDSLFSWTDGPVAAADPCNQRDGLKKLVRYEDSLRTVVGHATDPMGAGGALGVFAFDFDLSSPFELHTEQFAYHHIQDSTILVGADTLFRSGKVVQVFSAIPGGFSFGYGLGLVSSSFNEAGGTEGALIHAVVDGVEYGNQYSMVSVGSTKGLLQRELVLYPNPVADILHASWSSDGVPVTSVSVVDILGRIVAKQSGVWYGLAPGYAQLRVDHLPAGVYFVGLSNHGGTLVATSFIKVP